MTEFSEMIDREGDAPLIPDHSDSKNVFTSTEDTYGYTYGTSSLVIFLSHFNLQENLQRRGSPITRGHHLSD